jgi:hypothetical protein
MTRRDTQGLGNWQVRQRAEVQGATHQRLAPHARRDISTLHSRGSVAKPRLRSGRGTPLHNCCITFTRAPNPENNVCDLKAMTFFIWEPFRSVLRLPPPNPLPISIWPGHLASAPSPSGRNCFRTRRLQVFCNIIRVRGSSNPVYMHADGEWNDGR